MVEAGGQVIGVDRFEDIPKDYRIQNEAALTFMSWQGARQFYGVCGRHQGSREIFSRYLVITGGVLGTPG